MSRDDVDFAEKKEKRVVLKRRYDVLYVITVPFAWLSDRPMSDITTTHSNGNTVSPPVVWSNEFKAVAAGCLAVVSAHRPTTQQTRRSVSD